jgi:hypothetical protein
MSEPVDAQVPSAPEDVSAPTPSRWWARIPLWARFAAPTLVLLVVVGIVLVAIPKTFDLSGEITLVNTTGDAYSSDTGANSCAGSGGYDDIAGGTTQVVITDQSGATVGVGHLNSGQVLTGDLGCDFRFRVASVPAGKSFYKVEVSHRGGIQYTEKEMRAGVSMTLG